MTDKYVSALWGDDSDSGDDAANAKATIQAGYDATTSNDTIFIYPGVYNESIILSAGKRAIFQAIGKAILDGDKLLKNGILSTTSVGCSVKDLEIKNYTIYGIFIDDTAGITRDISNNIISYCSLGIFLSLDGALPIYNIYQNYFHKCGIGITDSSSDGVREYSNNTFYKCGMGIYISASTGSNLITIKDNIFSQNDAAVRIKETVNIAELDYNLYDVGAGAMYGRIGATSTYTTLADWQTAISDEANAIDADPLLANPDFGIFNILPGSPAESGASDGMYMGAGLTEIGWYSDTIMQNGVSLSGVQISALHNSISGMFLEAGEASGIIELSPIDMGKNYNIVTLLDLLNEDINNSKIVDVDISDNTSPSGELTFEFRVSDSLAGISGESYVEYSMRENIASGTFEGRYIQARLTLNG